MLVCISLGYRLHSVRAVLYNITGSETAKEQVNTNVRGLKGKKPEANLTTVSLGGGEHADTVSLFME
jgi:hypothetical protein